MSTARSHEAKRARCAESLGRRAGGAGGRHPLITLPGAFTSVSETSRSGPATVTSARVGHGHESHKLKERAHLGGSSFLWQASEVRGRFRRPRDCLMSYVIQITRIVTCSDALWDLLPSQQASGKTPPSGGRPQRRRSELLLCAIGYAPPPLRFLAIHLYAHCFLLFSGRRLPSEPKQRQPECLARLSRRSASRQLPRSEQRCVLFALNDIPHTAAAAGGPHGLRPIEALLQSALGWVVPCRRLAAEAAPSKIKTLAPKPARSVQYVGQHIHNTITCLFTSEASSHPRFPPPGPAGFALWRSAACFRCSGGFGVRKAGHACVRNHFGVWGCACGVLSSAFRTCHVLRAVLLSFDASLTMTCLFCADWIRCRVDDGIRSHHGIWRVRKVMALTQRRRACRSTLVS